MTLGVEEDQIHPGREPLPALVQAPPRLGVAPGLEPTSSDASDSAALNVKDVQSRTLPMEKLELDLDQTARRVGSRRGEFRPRPC